MNAVVDAPTREGAFRIIETWGALDAADVADITAFWIRERALSNPANLEKRLTQVVLFARDADGAIAGVATAVAALPPNFGQPMYYFRAFVARAWRSTTLVRELTLRACATLEKDARERGFPCIGVLLELENTGFYRTLRKPVWWNPRFHYVGLSERGLELRALYFEGARLKTPAELQALASIRTV